MARIWHILSKDPEHVCCGKHVKAVDAMHIEDIEAGHTLPGQTVCANCLSPVYKKNRKHKHKTRSVHA